MWLVVAIILKFIIKLRFPTDISISTIINRRYSSKVLTIFRTCEKLDKKHRKSTLDINFLQSCLDHGLIPKFLHFKAANQHLQRSTTYETCRKKLLTKELRLKRNQLKNTETKLKNNIKDLKTAVRYVDFIHLTSFISYNNIKSTRRVEIIQNRKLERLKQEYLSEGINPDKVIFNYSSYVLNDIEKKVLSRGLKFCVPPDKLDYCQTLTPFERLARTLKIQHNNRNSKVDFDYVKTKLKDIALSTYYSYSPDFLPLNISRAELSALKKLSRNKDLVIVRPDKGNGIVILDKLDYINKVELLLSDTCKFKKLNEDILDLCCKREGQLIRFLRDTLLKNRHISESVYHDLSPQGSKPGILYGLPKVHKETCPVRPIMSAIGTYNYGLAKFLVPILQPITSNQYTVNSSFSFVKEITNTTFSHGTVMVSFDVSSLFTNIPLDETISIILDNLFCETDAISFNGCSFNKAHFKKLLEFAVKNNNFIFNNQLHEQVDGVAMGSPLGPAFANIFMCALEKNFLSNCPLDFKPLLYRAYHICSSYLSFHKQVCSIKRFLLQNRFPIHLINRVIRNFLDKQYVTKINSQNVPKLSVLILLPYLGVHSIRLKRKLNKFLGKIYPHIDFQFIFQSAKRIENFFPFKDRAPKHARSSIVYKFTCSSCKATYYGKISRHFIVRCREHLGVNKKGKSIKGVSSSIRDHINDTGHNASLDDFCVIDNTSNELDLLIHESLLILKRPSHA